MPALDVVAEHLLAEFLEAFWIGRFVDTVEGGSSQRHETRGHSLIGQQHELLDQLVGEVVFEPLQAQDASLLIQPDL